MKQKIKYVYVLLMFVLSSNMYSQNLSSEEQKAKYNIHLDPSLGVFSNSTFGVHPSVYVGISIGFKEKNKVGFGYEQMFGDSKNDYLTKGDNDVFFTTNKFKQLNRSLFYERLLVDKPKNELSVYVGVGLDRIKIKKNDFLKDDKELQGLGVDLGLVYVPFFNKHHAIPLTFIYHFSNIKNKGGDNFNPNYFGLRFIYSYSNF